jgi:hypothetical protein
MDLRPRVRQARGFHFYWCDEDVEEISGEVVGNSTGGKETSALAKVEKRLIAQMNILNSSSPSPPVRSHYLSHRRRHSRPRWQSDCRS